MEEKHIVGYSRDYISVLFDMLLDLHRDTSFVIYPNLDNKVKIDLPIMNVEYRIMPLGTTPVKNKRVIFGTGGPRNKSNIFKYFLEHYAMDEDRYQRLIHESAYISLSSKIANGVVVEPLAVISSQTVLSFGVYIKRGSLIGHHNSIGAFTDINPGVTISSNVTIGAYCTIGSGAILREKISIGENSIIGMGSVVTKDIPANSVAYGNPCRVIKENLPFS